MKVYRRSMLTGAEGEMDLDVTSYQLAMLDQNGRSPIQDLFPNLSPAEREFLKSGITPAEWDAELGLDVEDFS